jgi:hypothetical protein
MSVTPPSDDEIIELLAAVLRRTPTAHEIGRVFAAVEIAARLAVEKVLGTPQEKP